MKSLKIMTLAITAALTLIAPYISNADNHHAKSPTFRSTQLTDNIYMLQGKGGNLGLVTGKQGYC